MNTRNFLAAGLLMVGPFLSQAQENIPIGTFRLHVSYNQIHDIAFDGLSQTFAASSHGVQKVDRRAGETTLYSKASGLSGGTISSIEFDVQTGKLVIAYKEGHFDVWDGKTVQHFDPASTSFVSGSRAINDVLIFDERTYLCTDYGVVVFDLASNQVRETWRDIGLEGSRLPVQHAATQGDSIFLTSPQGVLAGRLGDNLQDFNHWKRYLHWPFSNPVSGIVSWANTVYAAVDDAGIYKLDKGLWHIVPQMPVEKYHSLQASDALIISAPSGVYELNDEGVVRITSPLFEQPVYAATDAEGKYWIGDRNGGLVSGVPNNFQSLLPSCPGNDIVTNVSFSAGKILCVGGGNDERGEPLGRRGVIDFFVDGRWTQLEVDALDLVDVLWDEPLQTVVAASLGDGVLVKRSGSDIELYNAANSTLTSSRADGKVLVSALAKLASGVLALNYGETPELHQLRLSEGWNSLTTSVPTARFAHKLTVDGGGNLWMAINRAQGGGVLVFDPDAGTSRMLTTVTGQGALPDMDVRSLSLDRHGAMWIGTAQGVAYSPNASAMLQSPMDLIKPIYEGRFVLRDDTVTAIAVDGGNRKWFGTGRGIWLYNATVDKPLGSFTASNSLLPSDRVLDADVHQQTGEVFIATDQGLVSYRAGATEPTAGDNGIKIFPNPVPATFAGTVGITGTPANALVKITDVAGNLVWETHANGSTATWNLHDARGRRVPTGVYVVFTLSNDGEQREVGKVAVVN